MVSCKGPEGQAVEVVKTRTHEYWDQNVADKSLECVLALFEVHVNHDS